MEFLILMQVFVLLAVLVFIKDRYKICPPGKIIVVYGTTSGNNNPVFVQKGGVFVLPLVQAYTVLSLEHMTTDIDLKSALSKENILVKANVSFTFKISTDEAIMQNAAKYLLYQSKDEIISQANGIIIGQLRLAIATSTFEEIERDREKFLEQVNANVNPALNKIGLEIVSINILHISQGE